MRRTVLPNGVQVLSERISSSHTFSVGIFVGVGSRQEVDARHGASHFLEHVLFKGTRRRTAEEISAAIECVGGELNAYTAKEHTCFYARVQAGDADLAVDVLVDMVTESVVTAADVDVERAVILDEIAMHGDDPGEVVQDLVAAEVFAGSGLSQRVIGSETSIAALSRDEVVNHWQTHYRGGSLVVAAAGAVDHDRLVELVAPLASRPAGDPVLPAARTRPTPAGGLVTLKRGVEQINAVLAFPSAGVFDDIDRGVYDAQRYPLGLLSIILGGGMASRLFVEVRERRALTYGIDAGETAYSDAGVWSVDWQCGPDRLADILEVVRAELAAVAEHGVTATELARAQGQMRGQTVLGYEGPGAKMSRLGVNALLNDRRTLSEVLGQFDAVTRDDIQAAAARLFAQPPVLGLVGPAAPARVLRAWSAHPTIG